MLSTDRRDYSGCSLPQLPNTAQEAEYLQAKSSSWHLKPATFTGTEATEAQVKALHSPYILHLATHGFFLPDIQPTNQTRTLQFDQKMPVVLHNPMQRSGLALAGAELTLDAWKRGEVPDTENDGILMADEVALLDLQNTWLVTLSACDTGIGEARAGEGVLGLRRGFIQAGAQNLLMTLWPVSDKWTVDLMKGFYDVAMRTGNAPDALADVQREYLVKLKTEKNLVFAARLAGPFVMNFQGKP
jgi:CHAT domain-containing protein